jgi:hypothetical protein
MAKQQQRGGQSGMVFFFGVAVGVAFSIITGIDTLLRTM